MANERRQLFQTIAAQLGGTLISSVPLTGGSSAEAHALEVKLASAPARFVFRHYSSADFKGRDKHVVAKEYHLLRALYRQSFAVADACLFSEADNWVVTTWIDGSIDVEAEYVSSALTQMAEFLSQVHNVALNLDQIDGLGHLEDPLHGVLPYLPATASGEALQLAIEAEEIGLFPNRPTLIHGDYWPGNVLWQHDQLAGVIDWEDAQRGDPLADLAGARLELLCHYDEQAMQQFTEHYLGLNPHVDLRSLPVWEIYVAASALATMHHWGLAVDAEAVRRSRTDAFYERAARELLLSL